MAETRIPVQEVSFESHTGTVIAIYESDSMGGYQFVRFEVEQRRRRRRRGRKPGPKPGMKRKYRRRKQQRAAAAQS